MKTSYDKPIVPNMNNTKTMFFRIIPLISGMFISKEPLMSIVETRIVRRSNVRFTY